MGDNRIPKYAGVLISSGAYEFDPKTPKSSQTLVFVQKGEFLKSKPRTARKAQWEFYMLMLWSQVLSKYQTQTGLAIACPDPRSLFLGKSCPPPDQPDRRDIVGTTLGMEFATGLNASRLEHLARNAILVNHDAIHPAKSYSQLYPSIAFYCGALGKIKENEGLLHGDYQPRHVILDPQKPCLYIFDLDNARRGSPEQIVQEDMQMMERLKQSIGKKYKPGLIDAAFQEGRKLVPEMQILPEVVEELQSKLRLTLNFRYRRVEKNGRDDDFSS